MIRAYDIDQRKNMYTIGHGWKVVPEREDDGWAEYLKACQEDPKSDNLSSTFPKPVR